MSKPKIVLDATPLLYGKIGLSRVIEKLIVEIKQETNKAEIVLYSRSFSKRPSHQLYHTMQSLHLPLPRCTEKILSSFGVVEQWTKGALFHATDHFMPLKKTERCLVTIHDLIFLKSKEKNWEAHQYFLKVVPSFIKKVKSIVTISEASKKDIVEFFDVDPGAVTVIPWGVDLEMFKPPTQKTAVERPYFLSIGSHIPRKNAKNTIKAYLKLAKLSPINDLLFVGKITTELNRLLKSTPFSNRICFLGAVTDKQLVKLYQNASAFIFPSTLEGFGCPVLEAMACGCCVITSNTSSLPEVGGNVANYVDPLDVDSIFKAMEKIENQECEIEQKRKLSEKWVQQFSWKKCAMKYMTLYGTSLGLEL